LRPNHPPKDNLSNVYPLSSIHLHDCIQKTTKRQNMKWCLNQNKISFIPKEGIKRGNKNGIPIVSMTNEIFEIIFGLFQGWNTSFIGNIYLIYEQHFFEEHRYLRYWNPLSAWEYKCLVSSKWKFFRTFLALFFHSFYFHSVQYTYWSIAGKIRWLKALRYCLF